MTEVVLQGTSIVAIVGELVSAGVPEHVRVVVPSMFPAIVVVSFSGVAALCAPRWAAEPRLRHRRRLLCQPLSAPFQALHHSASNICQASIVCQHLPSNYLPRPTTSASNLPASAPASGPKHLSQHLNGSSICSSIWASISSISVSIGQHLAGSPVCCALWTSISSIGASVHLFRPR